MASQALQKVVKRIFSDESTKAKFLADPASVLSQFRLKAGEKKAVLATHAKLGLVDGNSSVLQAEIGPMYWWM
jgi:hypothetical protein